MPLNKDEMDGIAKLGKEVVKPLYEDAIQPVAKQVGKSLETVGGVINTALIPVELAVYGFSIIKDNLKEKLEKKLSSVPTEDIISPPLSLVGPLLERYKYIFKEKDLSEMFINLLANAMNKEQTKKAHPSFVNMISDLSPDEARLIKRMSQEGGFPKLDIKIRKKEGTKGGYQYVYINLTSLGEEAGLNNPEFTPSYLNNLERLSIIYIGFGAFSETFVDEGLYEKLENSPIIQKIKNKIKENERIEIAKGVIRVTDFGEMFMEAVLN